MRFQVDEHKYDLSLIVKQPAGSANLTLPALFLSAMLLPDVFCLLQAVIDLTFINTQLFCNFTHLIAVHLLQHDCLRDIRIFRIHPLFQPLKLHPCKFGGHHSVFYCFFIAAFGKTVQADDVRLAVLWSSTIRALVTLICVWASDQSASLSKNVATRTAISLRMLYIELRPLEVRQRLIRGRKIIYNNRITRAKIKSLAIIPGDTIIFKADKSIKAKNIAMSLEKPAKILLVLGVIFSVVNQFVDINMI